MLRGGCDSGVAVRADPVDLEPERFAIILVADRERHAANVGWIERAAIAMKCARLSHGPSRPMRFAQASCTRMVGWSIAPARRCAPNTPLRYSLT